MKKNIKIAIVGGGIGGITTALCLEYFGFHNYTVYEQAPLFSEVGAAISLWPNALRVYQKIGLYENISQHWGEFGTAYVKTDQGDTLTEANPSYDLPAVCIHRAALHQTLVKQLPKEKLWADHRLKSYEIGEKESTLFFENGKKTTAQIVIGADGINSTLRKGIINDQAPIYRGYNIWRGIATLENIPLGYASETWGKGARIGIVPIKGQQFGWWATLNEEQNTSDEPEGTFKKLTRIFGDWHQPIPQLFENSPQILKNAIGDRPPTKGWSKGNAVLMGDAAHPTTPNLGQGACMAIEGAYLLAHCLEELEELSTAFARYEKLHFARTASIVKQSLQNGKLGQLENNLAVKARNNLAKAMPTKLAMRIFDKFFSYDVTAVKIK